MISSKNLQITANHWQLILKRGIFFPEDGILVPKHFGDMILIFMYN
jgi:hypothetical protein